MHKKTSFITTVDSGGKVVRKANLPNDEKQILDYFERLDSKTRIVIESTASWYWLHDLLTENGFEVILSNPQKTKAIASAKIKNDKVDSHMLAQLLRADLIPPVHVCALSTRKIKELLRHRQKLVADATRMKNRIHILLRKNNFHTPFSDLFGVKGKEYLRQIPLPDYQRKHLKTYLKLHSQLISQIDPLNKSIQALAKIHPAAKLLMTIPGVGPIVAMFIVAEIEDITRFSSYRKLASYAGLVPSPPCVRIVVTSDEPRHRRGSLGASLAVAPAVSPLISIRGRRRLTCPIRICSKMR